MVRVGGLQQKVALNIPYGSGADRTPAKDQLEQINILVRELTASAYAVLRDEVQPGLEREGIVLRTARDLNEGQRRHLTERRG